MYYNTSFDEMPKDMLLHGKLINDGGHNLFQRDPPPSFRKKRRRKYVDKEVEVDDSVFESAKQAVAPKEVKKDEIEESQHPPSEENVTENPQESVENQAVEKYSSLLKIRRTSLIKCHFENSLTSYTIHG